MNQLALFKSLSTLSFCARASISAGQSSDKAKPENSKDSISLADIADKKHIRTGSFQGAILTGEEPLAEKVTLNDLLGAAIVDKEGNELGRVVDLNLDEDDRIVTAYISIGGFLGLGDTMVLAPYQQFVWDQENGHFSVDASQKDVQTFIENYHQDGETSASDNEAAQGEKKTLSKDELEQTVAKIRKAAQERDAIRGLNGETRVSAGDGAIILKGTLPSEEMHMKLLELVHQHSGDIGVIDQLKIQSSEPRPASVSESSESASSAS